MTLPLGHVVPGLEQPILRFDSEYVFAVGQLHPSRVRLVEDGWMLVDRQRRWLALSTPSTAPAVFQPIRAYASGDQAEDGASRQVAQVLGSIGEDLTSTEKAEALAEILEAEPNPTPAELVRRFGAPEAQVRFPIQLAWAPPCVRALGAGEKALPLWNLAVLLRLHGRSPAANFGEPPAGFGGRR